MAADDWIEFDGTELINVGRTVVLAEALGIDSVWLLEDSVAWIGDALGEDDYGDITVAPWYDAGYPASGEFAGVLSLGFPGLDDSTLSASPIEYITDGGRSGKPRNSTLSIVASAAIIARTERGAEFGKRWLDRRLRSARGERMFCNGARMRYFRYADESAPIVHRRDVALTRGTSVTRKRATDCSVTWLVTFTLTAGDPFEYGEAEEVLAELGGEGEPTSPLLDESGTVALVEQSCPVWDYSPVFDPSHPALVPSPTVPDFYPNGWTIADGMTFQRYWAKLLPLEPSGLGYTPIITLQTEGLNQPARMVRVALYPGTSDFDDQCEPLFTAIATYVPGEVQFVIDGEQQASYVWDGVSPVVRRTDSLVYGTDATPVLWSSVSDDAGLMVTLDLFEVDSDEPAPQVLMALALMPKSD